MFIRSLTLIAVFVGLHFVNVSQAKATAWAYCGYQYDGCVEWQLDPPSWEGAPQSERCVRTEKQMIALMTSNCVRYDSSCPRDSTCQPTCIEWGPDIPNPNTGDGSGLHAFSNSGTARPDLDYICKLPVASQMGVNYVDRCVNADISNCQADAGGKPAESFGENDVPSEGWYNPPGNLWFPTAVRCRCGCFTSDTLIKTANGYGAIEVVSADAYLNPIRVALPFLSNKAREQKYSGLLVTRNFTKGPENKPILRIKLENGKFIDLTDMHPVLVKEKGALKMIQASKVNLDSTLLTEDRHEVKVKEIETRVLQGNNSVYNVDTKEATAEGHIVSANGLQMGDMIWQQKLSEQEERINNILQ
ncbi:MAG: hypothetical protein HQK51_10155 [Oligoflexia bacterium]|nr:hypothetical protein [Oligoflexia bacterium]